MAGTGGDLTNTTGAISPFDTIKHQDDGGDYWSARELAALLGYTDWRNFMRVIAKAKEACEGSGQVISDHFSEMSMSAAIGSGATRELSDYSLSRYALHLVLICGDLHKPEIVESLVYLTLAAMDGNTDYCLMAATFGGSFSSRIALTKEQRTIDQIVRAFAHLRSERQYRVASFAIDLYFPDQRIAVECDENGHHHYDPESEARRQRHIERALKYTFVRYNPDAPDFNIGDVINRIMRLVYETTRCKAVVA